MEAQVADELRTDMGEVISPSEELFNLAVQGLLMLGQSQVQLPTHRMSHDMHASNDVHIERTKQDQPCGGPHGAGTPRSDELAPLRTGNITIEGSEEREDVFWESPSIQHTQETTGGSHGPDRVPDSPMDGSVQRGERPRGGAYGAGMPDIIKLAGYATPGVPVTQPPGMKDPPWLPHPPTGHLSWWEDDTKQATMRAISSEIRNPVAEISTSKARDHTKYFPHSEWDYEAGGFALCDPFPQPMILGKITVLIKPTRAWKIKHSVRPVGTLSSQWERMPQAETCAPDGRGGAQCGDLHGLPSFAGGHRGADHECVLGRLWEAGTGSRGLPPHGDDR